jgi:hypothetical protein
LWILRGRGRGMYRTRKFQPMTATLPADVLDERGDPL